MNIVLSNPNQAVSAVQGTAVVQRDAVTFGGLTCTDRTDGFSCAGNQPTPPAGTIPFVVVDLGGRCISAGTGPIVQLCLKDDAPGCLAGQNTTVTLQDVKVADCADQPLGATTQGGTILCHGLGDCKADGGKIDIFDVLEKIDILLGRNTPSPLQQVLCDDNCDGRIDIFDVLREIDVIVGRLTQPLACEGSTGHSAAPGATSSRAGSARAGRTPRVFVRNRSREIVLVNVDEPVRGVELTLTPEKGPVGVTGARATARTRGFLVSYHQADASGQVRVLVVSLEGKAVRAGARSIARLDLLPARHRGRLRLIDAKIAP